MRKSFQTCLFAICISMLACERSEVPVVVESAAPEGSGDDRAAGVSPLVGRWFYSLCMSGDCPTDVNIVTINEDGIYHWVEFEVIPDKIPAGSEGGWSPVGAELKSYETGRIDLKTGCEKIDPERLSESFLGITWEIKDGLLWRTQDLGTMGGDGVCFTKECKP